MGSGNALSFSLTTKAGVEVHQLAFQMAIVAGWTARDIAAMEKHMKELEEIGVARPAATPVYYRVGAARITTADSIQATGGNQRRSRIRDGGIGEALDRRRVRPYRPPGGSLQHHGVEAYVNKLVAAVLWPWEEVADHWDDRYFAPTPSSGQTRVVSGRKSCGHARHLI